MPYHQEGDQVTLTMTQDQYWNLLVLIGSGLAIMRRDGGPGFWSWIQLVNELNQGNPRWTPYAVPEQLS